LISQEYLKKHIKYDPTTGVFSVLVPRKGCSGKFRSIGQPLGTMTSHGYLKISLLGSSQYLHRLAFLYMTGELPETVDHVNGDKSDNRWANLRSCSQQENCRNKRVVKSKCGLKGVTNVGRRYRAQIVHNHKPMHLGYFDTAESAHDAYFQKALKLNGEFATKGSLHA
jgi:hypothetical protein